MQGRRSANGHEGAWSCACPCWGFQVSENSWRPQRETEARVAQLRRKLLARRRKRKSVKAFGRAFSSDESGDGPGEKRRALDFAESGEVELRTGVGVDGLQTNTRRLLRLVRAGYLRRVVGAWRDGALRQRRLREVSERLERAGAEFPIENAEGLRVALNMLHSGVALTTLHDRHGEGWKWTTLGQVFGASARTLSGFASEVQGVGARSVNRWIEVLNSSWQEQRLADQALEDGESWSDGGSDPTEVHQ